MTESQTDLPKGTLVAGRYAIVSRLGQGGMGMVYKARDLVLDETVAFKVLRADLVGQGEFAERFRQEIKLARRVRHKNVCAMHEFGEDGALRFIVMEFIDGADLRIMVRAAGGLPWPEAYEAAIQLCDGLQAIHDEGIIHRDLKTPNIMQDARGFVRLMDFGIAKLTDADATGPITVTGQILGTPEYMSPEQIRGEKVDARIDIYALGVVIFEIFSGRVPFKGDTPIATIYKQLQDPPPLSGTDRLPPSLISVLRKALAKDREDRFRSASEMGAALRQARSAVRAEATLAPTRPADAPPPVATLSPRCPLCSEPIKPGARKCPHCKEFLDPALKAQREHGADLQQRRTRQKTELDGSVNQSFIIAIAGCAIASCLGPLGGPYCMVRARQLRKKYAALELEPPPRVRSLRIVGMLWLGLGGLIWLAVGFNALPDPPPPPAATRVAPWPSAPGANAAVPPTGTVAPAQAAPAAPVTEEARLAAGCEAGNPDDCYRLGTLSSSKASYSRAVAYFEKACGGRHALACANLGFLSENGFGTAIDVTRAITAYKKACAQGEACEQYRRLGGTP